MTNLLSHAHKALAIALILLISSIPAWAAPEPEPLSNFVERGMELWHVPGMAVAVVSSEQTLFQQAFGKTAIENGQEIDEHTLFAIASTTKAMVVAAILILQDEGKLSLDDPIVKHIPELHFKDPLLTQQLMVRDLLAHRTGLPSTDFWTFFMGMPLDEQIQRLGSVPVTAPMRTRLIYQNTMYELAGVLIERLSGVRWDTFIRERLWQPIGMNETFGARSQIRSELQYVMPYFLNGEELVRADWDFPADLAEAAGSVWSSIHDMGLWASFLLRGGVTVDGERLISPDGIEEMFTPHQLSNAADFYPTTALTHPNWISYGLGWFQQDFQGRKIDFHTGSLSGLIAIIGLDRAGDRAVIALGNRDHAEMRHAILWEVMDNSPNGEKRDWNQAIWALYQDQVEQGNDQWKETQRKRLKKTRPSLARDDYAGTYESPAMGKITIKREGKGLVLDAGRVRLAMSHWHLDTFLVEYPEWELKEFAEFRLGPDGKIDTLTMFGEDFKPAHP
jgi:CubicO group peptidase (beta-lactamase class C family)